MKKFSYFVLFFILVILLTYISFITNIPTNQILFKDEGLKLKRLVGITIEDEGKNEEIIPASTLEETQIIKSNIKLFGIKIKSINIEYIENPEVRVCGNLIGMKLYTNGVLVVGMSEIYGLDNNIYKPYEKTGIEEGDRILKIDDTEISTTNELVNSINLSNGKEIKITYIHNNETLETSIIPAKTETNDYKLGLWVRDTAAGVGTATFYNEEDKIIATLGHGLVDVDTNELIEISSGELTTTEIVSLQKGENGVTGRIKGTVDGQSVIGNIMKNTYFGVYAKLNNTNKIKLELLPKMHIASRNEIKKGEAKVLCVTDKTGKINEYSLEIEKIYQNNNTNNKSMLVEIKDKELLEKTGGIIQGMSGSPIIQDGKLVGALTHVLVNDPKKGYAVFGDIMIKQMREIN